VRCARVSCAGTKGKSLARTDRGVVPDGCGHGHGIGGGSETACTDGLSGGGVREIELERIIGEEIDPCNVGRGFQEFRDEVGVILGDNDGESDRGKDE